MVNFEFQNTTKIYFGKDAEKGIREKVKKYGYKVLLHYGGGSIKKNRVYQKIMEELQKNEIQVWELGGGSAIDSDKGIAVGVPYEGDVWDFYEGISLPKKKLPLGVVLTLPATGSESGYSSVVTKEEGMLHAPWTMTFYIRTLLF